MHIIVRKGAVVLVLTDGAKLMVMSDKKMGLTLHASLQGSSDDGQHPRTPRLCHSRGESKPYHVAEVATKMALLPGALLPGAHCLPDSPVVGMTRMVRATWKQDWGI